MRSLTVKLTFAFVLVGVLGVILVTLIVGLRTRQEFNRFVQDQGHQDLAANLGLSYVQYQGWSGVVENIPNLPFLHTVLNQMVLVDEDGRVLFGPSPEQNGTFYVPQPGFKGVAIEVNGRVVGSVFLLSERPHPGPWADPRFSPATSFLYNVNMASFLSAIIATLVALIVGFLLARTLTKPLRELTQATQAMAAGQLDQRVEVYAADEIGELAHSFNLMSQDLAQASQLRKQMTADIAHDLRTPLSILRGYTEGLKNGSLAASTAVYNTMHEEVIHLQHLVEDLRTLSLADAGELPLHRRAVDPRALLERAGLAYVMQAEQKGVQLRIEAAENLPSVTVDVERMTQLLNNLVANALRFTDQGEIVLSAGTTAVDGADALYLQVRDTGVGIPSNELPHIFDRFYRADKSRQRMPDGSSGLGLAIARAIAEAHQGQIAVHSTLGQGSTFTVTLAL